MKKNHTFKETCIITIIVIIIIIIVIIITFIQGIYNCVPESNHVCRVYNIADIQRFLIWYM